MTAEPLIHPNHPILTLALCLVLPCTVAHAQGAGEQETRIASALRDGDNAAAIQLLGPALRQFPEDAQLWTMQGVAYDRQGKKKEALASFEHALKIAPDSIPALQGAAQINFDAGSPRAIPFLERLLRLHPNDVTSHGMLAILEYQQGNCSRALPHFEKAAAMFQSQGDALHAYAICLVKGKELDKAATVLKRTAELKSNDPRDLRLLASIELMAHHPDAALNALQPLLSSGAQDAETLELAAAAYEGSHDTEKAVDSLRQAILLQPTNADLYVEFANLSAAHQSFKVGINVLNDGLALQPQSASLYFARGMLYAQMSSYDKAQADFETAYRLDPSQSLTNAAQGMLAVQESDLDGALKTIESKLARKPNDAILLYLQADILTQKGAMPGSETFETAMRSARRSVALSPGLAPAHAVLARLYLESEDYPKAISECRKALELNPKDQTSLYRLIQATRKTEHGNEVPGLLRQLAQLREETTREERERYRYRLVEGGTSTP
jgi:tetratricopeptide (TPR) repeat protein